MMNVIEIGFLVILIFTFFGLQFAKMIFNYAEHENKNTVVVLRCIIILLFILMGIYLYAHNKILFYIIMCYENNLLYTSIQTKCKD